MRPDDDDLVAAISPWHLRRDVREGLAAGLVRLPDGDMSNLGQGRLDELQGILQGAVVVAVPRADLRSEADDVALEPPPLRFGAAARDPAALAEWSFDVHAWAGFRYL